jgi:hypothetical protein
LQRLKRNHNLVVLNKIAGQKQEPCMFHRASSSAPSLP